MRMNKKELKDILVGVSFLTPNICGFLAFTLIPLLISLYMAFTNWNLETHNMFKDNPVTFVGLENFRQLLSEKDFYKYLGNTLFFMMRIPIGIAGSLIAAILLSSNFRGGNKRIWLTSVATIMLIVGCGAMVLGGMGATAMTILICGLFGVVIVSGSLGGQTVYRTLFYFPHFTAGVATFILWKKLYSPDTGPINYALTPLLNTIAPGLAAIPHSGAVVTAAGMTLLIVGICLYGVYRNTALWRDGESGIISLLIGSVFLSLPLIYMAPWTPFQTLRHLAFVPPALAWVMVAVRLGKGRRHPSNPDEGLADAVIICGAVMAGCFILLGLSRVVYGLPEMAADGLEPPKWIADYHWAKPSLMIMGFWAAIGSNNMLLYLAGLSGVSQELYEAADIDGASGLQRFWHVTWPQLANITFFILIMGIIHGLQGGFEMARTMTEGGPFHATTTLSYYIYTEGFATGRLGYASAVSWALFALTLSITLFNWKFGNRYTND